MRNTIALDARVLFIGVTVEFNIGAYAWECFSMIVRVAARRWGCGNDSFWDSGPAAGARVCRVRCVCVWVYIVRMMCFVYTRE